MIKNTTVDFVSTYPNLIGDEVINRAFGVHSWHDEMIRTFDEQMEEFFANEKAVKEYFGDGPIDETLTMSYNSNKDSYTVVNPLYTHEAYTISINKPSSVDVSWDVDMNKDGNKEHARSYGKFFLLIALYLAIKEVERK